MKKVLVHENDGDPIYIVRSDQMAFHVIYQGNDMGSHNSIRLAIDSASTEFIDAGSRGVVGWHALEWLY